MLARAARTLVFLAAGVAVGAAALAALIAGWVVVPVLAITPLVVPALVAYRGLVGGIARLDGELANELLGTSVRPPYRSPGPPGFWRAGWNVLSDGSFWRQQGYLAIRISFGFAAAVFEWSLLAASLALVAMPVWYRWTDVQILDGRRVDTLGRAFLCVPPGLVGLAVALALLRPLEHVSRALVYGLLGGERDMDMTREQSLAQRRAALTIHGAVVGALVLFLVGIWAITAHGTFWPVWVMIGLGGPLAVHAAVYAVDARPFGPSRGLALHELLALVLAALFVATWGAGGHGTFWPVWPIFVLAATLIVHAGLVYAQRTSRRRIAVLEETRAGAVDQQETDLQRIERDLHDGAQARLVALGMSLGMAEQKLASDPDAAQALLAEARQGMREALEELRNLARGIRPPVLTDRGLEAALMALADRTPVRVDIHVELARRPARAVETAAYYVAAEALANAGKHAGARRVDITIREDAGSLVVEVMDDGAGGADPAGNGLRGLARRVEALDGRLGVRSPAGGPTIIQAVIPCAP